MIWTIFRDQLLLADCKMIASNVTQPVGVAFRNFHPNTVLCEGKFKFKSKILENKNKRPMDLGALLDSCIWHDIGNFLQTCIKNSLLQTKSIEI